MDATNLDLLNVIIYFSLFVSLMMGFSKGGQR